MTKKLPKIYQSTFSHPIQNNEKIYYSKNQTLNKNIKSQVIKKEDTLVPIEKVIDELFHTTGYVFNIPVEIITNERKVETYIAGKVNNTLITLDNELIPISSIVSIKRK